MRDCGRIGYAEAFAMQRELVEQRKRGEIPDQLAVRRASACDHSRPQRAHGKPARVRARCCGARALSFDETDRGGDITYHGPGQIVGYPIFDLRDWKRDVVAYVRAMEQAIIDALAGFGIESGREPGATGVWTDGRERSAPSACISAAG